MGVLFSSPSRPSRDVSRVTRFRAHLVRFPANSKARTQWLRTSKGGEVRDYQSRNCFVGMSATPFPRYRSRRGPSINVNQPLNNDAPLQRGFYCIAERAKLDKSNTMFCSLRPTKKSIFTTNIFPIPLLSIFTSFIDFETNLVIKFEKSYRLEVFH